MFGSLLSGNTVATHRQVFWLKSELKIGRESRPLTNVAGLKTIVFVCSDKTQGSRGMC